MSFLILIGCGKTRENDRSKSIDSNRFIKIEIQDKYLKGIANQYSKSYDFGGKGVIIANIKSMHDSTKYVLNLFLERDFFDIWLKDKQFILYDTLGGRLILLSTQLESTLSFTNIVKQNDTILDKYLRKDKGFDEIWQVEYTRIDSIIKRKVVYYNPFD
jgi:hypothetical protein